MSIDRMEYAKVHDENGYFKEYVYGEYDEIELYCKNNKSFVDKYFDHVDPMTVQKGFRYVGRRDVPPCDAANPFEYNGTPRDKQKWAIEKW